jgi:hypothetical protein
MYAQFKVFDQSGKILFQAETQNGQFDVLTQRDVNPRHPNTGLDYVPDQWQVWAFDYTIGDTSSSGGFSLTIDGQTASGLQLWDDADTPADGTIGSIQFRTAVDGTEFYVDSSIPEPATMALLGMGGLAMIGRRRNR